MILTLAAAPDVSGGSPSPTGNSIRLNQLSGNTPFDIYGDGSGTGNTVSGNSCRTTNLTGAC